MNRHSLKSLLISTLVVAAVAYGSSVTLPYTFSPGATARASEVNANFTAVKTAVDDNNARINTLLAPPVWTAPTFLPSPGTPAWANVGAPYMVAGYTKDGLGYVRLRGLVKRTGATGNIFALPQGYTPSAVLQFPARCGDNSLCAIHINPNGNVDYYGPGSPNGSLTLDGIVFFPN